MKTTTIAVQFASAISVFRRRSDVEVMGRRLPVDLVSRAVAVVLVTVALVLGSTFLLACMEELPFMSLLFEVSSAVATTGLSTGVTSGLCDGSKIVLIIDMFFGRIGPISLFLILGRRSDPGPSYRFASERVLIG